MNCIKVTLLFYVHCSYSTEVFEYDMTVVIFKLHIFSNISSYLFDKHAHERDGTKIRKYDAIFNPRHRSESFECMCTVRNGAISNTNEAIGDKI
jgi:hypothetical protein